MIHITQSIWNCNFLIMLQMFSSLAIPVLQKFSFTINTPDIIFPYCQNTFGRPDDRNKHLYKEHNCAAYYTKHIYKPKGLRITKQTFVRNIFLNIKTKCHQINLSYTHTRLYVLYIFPIFIHMNFVKTNNSSVRYIPAFVYE